MGKKLLVIIIGFLVVIITFGVSLYSKQRPAPLCPKQLGTPGVPSMPDPAAVYCHSLGYKIKIVDTEEGQVGYCIFPDGNGCEEWDFFLGKCGQKFTYCEKYGKGKIESGKDGALCIFPDGAKCKEWDYCSGKCP